LVHLIEVLPIAFKLHATTFQNNHSHTNIAKTNPALVLFRVQVFLILARNNPALNHFFNRFTIRYGNKKSGTETTGHRGSMLSNGL
jgi:hypothetical protein